MNAYRDWLSDLHRERVALGLAVDWRRVFVVGTLGALFVVVAWIVST